MRSEFKRYTRTEPVFQMRKLSLEEVLGEVNVTRGPRVANAGDMLAKDSKDQWLIPKDVVEKYYKLVEEEKKKTPKTNPRMEKFLLDHRNELKRLIEERHLNELEHTRRLFNGSANKVTLDRDEFDSFASVGGVRVKVIIKLG